MGFQVVCASDQNLLGMRTATLQWLQLVDTAAGAMDMADAASVERDPLLLMFVYCGHGSADRLFPVDAPKKPAPEETFSFFEDFLFRLYDVLSFNCRLRHDWPQGPTSSRDNPDWEWRPWQTQVVSIIESCRRLSKEEQHAYEQQRARITSGRRHLLPCMSSLRPDLAPMGGAEWDAARLSFLTQLGANSPQLLVALSSESTTPSYDVVYLRSIVEQIDRPVRFLGILERAGLDTLRRTGHKQRPVLLLLCDQTERPARDSVVRFQELVLAQSQAGLGYAGGAPALLLRRSSSSGNIFETECGRAQLSRKEQTARCSNSRTRTSLPALL